MAPIRKRGATMDTASREPTDEVLAMLAALGDVEVHADHVSAVVGLADATPVLESLRSRHLVEGDGGRYRATDPAALPAPDRADADGWMERLFEHLVAWLAGAGRRDPRRVVADLDLVTACLDWAGGTRRWRQVLRLVRAVDAPLSLSGRWGSWEAALGNGLEAARALGDRSSEAWALHQLGTRALGLGDTATAHRHLASALGLRERLGDCSGAEVSRHNLRLAQRQAKAS